MFKLKVFKKIIAIVANLSLLLNSFVPFLLVAQPVYAQNSETIISTIEYDQSANKIDINTNSSDKITYQLFYKTDEKIDAIVGNDLNEGDFYLGTCSSGDCLPQNINRGILKIETGSNQFHSQFFTLENNILTVVKEIESSESDLIDEENIFLNNGEFIESTNWTFQKVELNKEYIAPQNSGVKLTFTKLPASSGNIKIEEIILTPEQIEQTGALSNKAYDITSDMVDGTFEYNLSLPIPSFVDQNQVNIKYSEDISSLDSVYSINTFTKNNTSVSIKNLDHFTIFIVSTTLSSATLNNQSQVSVYPGETITANIKVKLNKLSGWRYSAWKIDNNEWNIVDTQDHLNLIWFDEYFNENLSIIAPTEIGTHDVSFKVCPFNPINDCKTIKLTEGIIVEPLCGNGVIESGETCDDSNILNGDGCSNSCVVENGWECTGNPSSCRDILPPSTPTGIYFKDTVNNKNVNCGDKTNTKHLNVHWDKNTESDFDYYEYVSYNSNGSTGPIRTFTDNYFNASWWTIPSEGTYGVQIRAVDKAGNKSDWFGGNQSVINSCKYIVDWTAPTIIIGDYITTPTNQNITITATSDGNLNVGSTTFMANGSFTFIAKDDAGNSSTKTVTIDNIDKAKPIATITTPTEGDILKGVVNISGTVADDHPHHYWLAIYRKSDGKEIYSKVVNHSNSINGLLYSWDTIGLIDGEYQIKFAERDAADNRSSDSIVNITIDNTSPIITVNPYITNDKTPVLTGTINDNSAAISVKIGTNTFSVVNNGTGNWTLDNVTSNIADGTYDVVATATDTAGNIGIDSTTNELTIDSVAPMATFQHYINGNLFTGPIAYTNSLNKLTFTAEYTDTNPSSQLLKDSYVIFDAQTDHSFKFSQNGAKAYCGWRQEPNLVTGLSGNSFSLTTPENFSNCVSSLADGEYYMTHQVYDNAIRQDIPSITQFRDVLGLHFIIDTIDPISTINGGDNNSTVYSSSWDGSLSGTATDNLSGVAGVQVSIKNGASKYFNGSSFNEDTEFLLDATYNESTNTWGYLGLTNPLEDSYTVKSHAIDNSGNVENTYTLTIIFDKTIPEVSVSINPTNPDASNGWYKTQPEITLTATDDNFDKIEYQWDSKTGSWNTYSTSFKLENEGSHILYYRAYDKADNYSEIGIKNISWDKTDLENGPQNITANPNPTSGSTSKIKWEMAKDNIGIDKYEIQWKLNDDNKSLSYSKTVGADTTEVEIDQLIEGRWTVKVIAFDQSGKTRDNSIDVIVDQTGPSAPTLILTNTGTGTATLSWNAVNDAKDYIIWYGNTSGQYLYGARVGNVTSYAVRGLGSGNYYFIVKAVDSAQNQSSNSNEVNTGNISGAPGTTLGQPAEGFSSEVLGDSTENSSGENTPNENVLGVSITKKSLLDWWWLSFLLIIPIYVIFKKVRSKNKNR